MKRIILIAALACSFLLGYAGVSAAWPGVPDRSEHRGYFRNVFDDKGDDVWEGGLPSSVDSASEFISYTKNKLNNGSSRDKTGAAFIIQTMIGLSRTKPPTSSQVADWEARVRYASSQGLVQWKYNLNYTVNSYYQGRYGGGSDPNDVAFYYDRGAQSAIVFRDEDGDILYAIRRACANPVGSVKALPKAVDFSISGRTTVSDSSPKPGDTITFKHYVKNNGPTDTNPTSIWWVALNSLTGGITGGQASSGTYDDGQEKNVYDETVFIPTSVAVGTRYCRQVGWDPTNESGGRNGRGTPVCARVGALYDLTPQVQASKSTVQEGDTVTFTYTVANEGPTVSAQTTCKPVGNNHGPGYTPLPQQDADRDSDAGFDPPSTNCPRTFPVTSGAPTQVATENVRITGLSPGERICRSLVISPKNEDGGFRASAEQCVVVAKTPYVHFLGSDVWAGGGFAANSGTCDNQAHITTRSNNLSGNQTAGSGSAYAAFALGTVTQFGSASKALLASGVADGKNMTFSNVDDSNLGHFGAPQHCIEDYVAQYQSATAASPGSYDVGSGPSGERRINGNANFHGRMINGARKVYLVNGDATISSDLTYSGNYANAAAIPSLVIIATGNIYVSAGVGQADGIFVTRGTFFTCSPKNEPATTSTCDKQLTINGAVKAQNIDFFRTFGAEGSSTQARQRPAEIFDLSSEVYLRNALNTADESTVTTDNVQELPPRF